MKVFFAGLSLMAVLSLALTGCGPKEESIAAAPGVTTGTPTGPAAAPGANAKPKADAQLSHDAPGAVPGSAPEFGTKVK